MGTKRKIIVIGNKEIADGIAQILSHRVIAEKQILDAFRTLMNYECDAIIIDFDAYLPQLEEFCQEIKRMELEPVLMGISAHDEDHVIGKMEKHGCKCYFIKRLLDVKELAENLTKPEYLGFMRNEKDIWRGSINPL